jgi:hypothetical protein
MTKLEYPKLTLKDGDIRYRSLEINDKGELVFETTDAGENTAKIAPNGGDEDYEYSYTVAANDVERLLLELIKDNFNDSEKFKEWLDSKQIKSEFWSY